MAENDNQTQNVFTRPKGLLSFNFYVDIDSVRIGGFQQVTGLAEDVGVIDFYGHKIPGRRKVEQPVVLKKGSVITRGVDGMLMWYKYFSDTVMGGDIIKRSTISIHLLDMTSESDKIARTYLLMNAFPSRYVGPELHSQADGILSIDELHISYDRLLVWPYGEIERGSEQSNG